MYKVFLLERTEPTRMGDVLAVGFASHGLEFCEAPATKALHLGEINVFVASVFQVFALMLLHHPMLCAESMFALAFHVGQL